MDLQGQGLAGTHNPPAPRLIVLHTIDDRCRVDSDCNTSNLVGEHVHKNRAYDGQRTGPEEPSKEPRDYQRLIVLGSADCDVEDSKPECGYDERHSSAIQFRPTQVSLRLQ